ncbi:MAG TPA: hypothetical protein VMN57_02380 [Anaerolineales bacterium]|nr:hypothetical protein [Anaerolineales bacterium]
MGLFGGKKTDAVVVAVHLDAGGRIDWLRAFERRGPTWSDWKKIPREAAITRIRAGERFMTGERIKYYAGTFNTFDPIRIEEVDGEIRLVSGQANGRGDSLARVPIL